jgi:hypothetical protein
MLMTYRLMLLSLASVVFAASACDDSDLARRQEEVAEAGRAVMPFDLEATTHVFHKRPDGGLQTVLADGDDAEQVQLIRAHLSDEAARFARGDFHDPAMIHGEDMAGLHALVMGYESVRVEYREVERGAEITYVSDDPALVEAIHEWFDAQLRDHGRHAVSSVEAR